MVQRSAVTLGLAWAAVFGTCGASAADEIVFKKEHGGGRVKCEIYRQDDDYIHYIDIAKNEDCGCSREIVEEVIVEEGEQVDVEAFFLKKAEQARDEKTREQATAIAEEARKRREAEAAKAAADPKGAQVNEYGDKILGKLRVRDSKTIKILPTKDTGSSEIQVDPFPEEDGKDPAAAPPAKPGAGKAPGNK